MGLKEKQAMANLDFGWAEKRLVENTGVNMKIEMDAPSFANDLDAIYNADQRGAVASANGIALVCRNEIGKEAFNEKRVNKVVLLNQATGKRSVKFEGTSLILACAFASSDNYFSEHEIQEAIENQL
jgi:hypothetical protein